MQYTRNYNLKKPDYTDFADIEDINDNMDKLDEELAAPTGDSADSTTTFTTSDTADGGASSWTTVPALTSGETHKSLFAKMSQMFKNIRFLYKLLGTTDISSIGNGTVTGGLSSLNDSFVEHTARHALLTIQNPTATTSYQLSDSITNYKNAEIVVVKSGKRGAFVNRLVDKDNFGIGGGDDISLTVYNNTSYNLYMECGFQDATTFRIATYHVAGWQIVAIYVVGIGKVTA